jgi:hypothetical protein
MLSGKIVRRIFVFEWKQGDCFMAGMTSRERWLAVLRRETPDRMPMDCWATPEATHNLMQHLGCSTETEMFQQLGIDRPFTAEPAHVGPPIPPGQDMYRCGYQDVDYGTGTYPECVVHPLAKYTTEKVRQEGIDNIRILGEGGGYILAPCRDIQSVSPVENIVAFYQTGLEYGGTVN